MSMLARGCTFVFAALLAYVAGPHAWAGFADLPIGHLKVTPGEGGKINVEARCFPTQSLIETLATTAGAAVTFDKPSLTYVTVWRPERFEPPEFWIKLVAVLSGQFQAREEKGTWRVYSPLDPDPPYDPSLSQPQILSRYGGRSPTTVVASGSNSIDSGLYILDGIPVPSPYLVIVQEDPDGSRHILLNGMVIRTIPPKIQGIHNVPALPGSGQFAEINDLCRYVAFDLYPRKLAETGSPAEAVAAAVRFAKTQQIVESVLDERKPVYLRFRGLSASLSLFGLNYDFDRGTIIGMGTSAGEPQTHQAGPIKEDIEHALQNGSVIVDSDFGQVTLSGQHALQEFRDLLNLAAPLSVHEAECVLSELIEDRAMSRELAANLPGSANDLLRGLNSALAKTASIEAPASPEETNQRLDDAIANIDN
jgi:hypothetical protein